LYAINAWSFALVYMLGMRFAGLQNIAIRHQFPLQLRSIVSHAARMIWFAEGMVKICASICEGSSCTAETFGTHGCV
jgi:hypothetical protein